MKVVGGLVDTLRQNGDIRHRHFNPYLTIASELSDILFTQNELKSNPDILNKLLNSSNLVVEIGCYFGKTLVELAIRNPNICVLGLDITYKRVVKTALRIKQNKLNNSFVGMCDGLFLLKDVLPKNIVHGLCVFFPDPWLKTRQGKNRLLNEEFIELAFEKIQKGGFFWLKTDQESYFLKTQFLLLQKGFIIDSFVPPKSLNEGSYITEFQNLFIRKQTPFFEGLYLKP